MTVFCCQTIDYFNLLPQCNCKCENNSTDKNTLTSAFIYTLVSLDLVLENALEGGTIPLDPLHSS